MAHALAAHDRDSSITYDYVVEFGCCYCGTDFPDTPAGWTAYEIHRSRAVLRALESAGYVIRPSDPLHPPIFESGRSSDHER